MGGGASHGLCKVMGFCLVKRSSEDEVNTCLVKLTADLAPEKGWSWDWGDNPFFVWKVGLYGREVPVVP